MPKLCGTGEASGVLHPKLATNAAKFSARSVSPERIISPESGVQANAVVAYKLLKATHGSQRRPCTEVSDRE